MDHGGSSRKGTHSVPGGAWCRDERLHAMGTLHSLHRARALATLLQRP